MKTERLFIVVLMLILLPVLCSGQQFGQPAVLVDIDHTVDSNGVTIRLVFTIPQELHVYSEPENSFEINITESHGLTRSEIIKPEPKPYTDSTGSQVNVLPSDAVVAIKTVYTDPDAEKWSLSGWIGYQGCSEMVCYPPEKREFSFSGDIPENAVFSDKEKELTEEKSVSGDTGGPDAVDVSEQEKDWGFWYGLLAYFGVGLLLSLTPCVYPMVGITVSIIGGESSSVKRTVFLTAVYVLGLALMYACVGLAVGLAGDRIAETSALFKSAWFLVPIGVIFIILGLSMFDVFTIQTPSGFSGKVQTIMGTLKGSVPGTFIMGVLSAFVVGPCISGPVAGLIIKIAETGEPLKGFIYFFALALGMSVILFFAGSASGVLPRAGTWMERIKQIMGVVLIWAAFYFTRGLTGKGIFIAASVTAVAFTLSILGLLKVPEPGSGRKGALRVVAGVLLMGGAVFMITTGQLESPQSTARHNADLEQIIGSSATIILLDFTAPDCTNCDEIEENVLNQPDVKKRLETINLVKLDYRTNQDIVKKFDIIGTPAFVFLTSDGEQIGETIYTADGKELREKIFELTDKKSQQ